MFTTQRCTIWEVVGSNPVLFKNIFFSNLDYYFENCLNLLFDRPGWVNVSNSYRFENFQGWKILGLIKIRTHNLQIWFVCSPKSDFSCCFRLSIGPCIVLVYKWLMLSQNKQTNKSLRHTVLKGCTLANKIKQKTLFLTKLRAVLEL